MTEQDGLFPEVKKPHHLTFGDRKYSDLSSEEAKLISAESQTMRNTEVARLHRLKHPATVSYCVKQHPRAKMPSPTNNHSPLEKEGRLKPDLYLGLTTYQAMCLKDHFHEQVQRHPERLLDTFMFKILYNDLYDLLKEKKVIR